MYDRCIICGAPLSENNTEGIGYECKAALKQAKYDVFMSNDENRLHLYLIEVKIVKNAFIEQFKNTKFRSDFKKKFYASMCETERISRKQLDIMVNWLQYEHDVYYKINCLINEEKKAFIRNGCEETKVTREQIEIARKKIKKS